MLLLKLTNKQHDSKAPEISRAVSIKLFNHLLHFENTYIKSCFYVK